MSQLTILFAEKRLEKGVKSMSVHIKPEEVPDHVMKYLARDTLAAIRRFYSIPENREKFERWKAEREGRRT